jgi:hypothetical protein
MSDENEVTETNLMPGADVQEPVQEALDLNFGLGEEVDDAEEPTEEVEEDVIEETEAAVEEEEEAVEDDTTDDGDQEEEDGDTSEEEEVTAEAPEEVAPAKTKKPMVPKSRLDEVLSKQKALQKQLDDMKAAQVVAESAPEEYDFATKEVEYQTLVLDGEADKAAELRHEMRKAEREQMAFEMRQEMTQTVNQNQQATALQTAATDLEANFPVFDQNSESYNAEYTQEVIDLRDAFITQGHGAVEALGKAANFVVKNYDLVETVADEGSALSGSKAPARKADEVAKKRAEVSKKLRAAEAQPPELPGESSAKRGEKGLDVASMSEDEFNALPEATLKRLRGDIV